MHFFGQPADIVVRLDDVRRISADGNTLNYGGIKRSLRQKTIAGVAFRVVLPVLLQQLFGGLLKNLDELVADNFSFLLGIGDSPKFRKKSRAGVDVLEADMEVFTEYALDDFFFAGAEQAVVDKNAGELISDRLMQEG